MVPGQMLKGGSTSSFVCYFLLCQIQVKVSTPAKKRGQQVEGVCESLQRIACWGQSQGQGTKVFFLFQAQCVIPGRLGNTQQCSSGVFCHFFPSPTRAAAAAQNPPQGRRALGWKRELAADALGSPEEGQAGISQSRNHMYALTANIQAQRLCSSGLGCTTAIAPRVLPSLPAPSAVHV